MPLAPIAGHKEVRSRLSQAVKSDKLPQVLLITGPAGVGKQRLGLWLAQRLFCETNRDEPCGVCGPCSRVLNLSHPDLHWFVPVLRPKGDPDKQVDEVAEALEGVMAERRANPFWTAPDGMSIHGIASARLLQRQAALMPVEGGWRVFIIGRADRLVPQESSQEAANALLKLLEEPPARSLFVLSTAEPGLMLPTIRSRSVPIRVGRLSDAEVQQFFAAAKPEFAAPGTVTSAHGSIGQVLSAHGAAREKATSAAREFLEAVERGPVAATERVLKQAAWQARGDFTALLDALAETLSADAKRAISGGRSVSTRQPSASLKAVELVMEARDRAQGNVNPQLLLGVLADELAMLEAG